MNILIRGLWLAGLLGGLCVGGCSRQPTRIDKIREVQAVSGEYLGDWLADRHAGSRMVILTPPRMEGMSEPSTGNETLVDHLAGRLEKKGMSVRREEVALSLLSESAHSELDDRKMAYMEQGVLLIPRQLAAVSKKLAGSADVLIVPQSSKNPVRYTELPPAGSGPVLVLLGSWPIDDPKAAVERTTVEAILQYRPRHSVPLDEPQPTSPEDIFNRRYRLISHP